jgi:hypothetical protein
MYVKITFKEIMPNIIVIIKLQNLKYILFIQRNNFMQETNQKKL